MKGHWAIHGFEATTIVLLVVIALTEVTFLTLPVTSANRVRQIPITTMTLTGSTSMMSTTELMSSTQMMSTMTNTIVAPIAGFPVESIFLGLLLGSGIVMALRRRQE